MKVLKIAAIIALCAPLFFSNSSVFAQKKTKSKAKEEQKALVKIGSENITLKDLEAAYLKNPKKNLKLLDLSKDSLIDFINLYTNYRLKVQEAVNLGLDKDPSVISEIEQNRNLISESYFFDKTLVIPNVNLLLERRKVELQLGVMLFALTQNSSDTMTAYNKAISAITALSNDEDFFEYGKKNSDDKDLSSRKHSITSSIIRKQIEDAAYNLKVGEFCKKPIKSKYGYFVIKVYSKENRIKVRPSQILFNENLATADSVKTIAKAKMVLERLKKGESFEKLAKEFSQDPNSAKNEGYLGAYYSRSTGFDKPNSQNERDNKLVPQFEEALFKLKDGEFSDLVYSGFGIHIIKRDSTKSFTADEERESLKKFYKKAYFEEDKKNFIDSIKKTLNFKLNDPNFNEFLSLVDTAKTTLDSNWMHKLTNIDKSKVLYSTDMKKITIADILDSIKIRKDMRVTPLSRAGITSVLEKMTTPDAFAYLTRNLDKDYPEFAQLQKEFKDGILLFKIEEQEVWNKLKFDTLQAKEYWEANKNKYMTENQYSFTEVFVLADSLSKVIYSKAKAGEDIEKLAAEFTQKSGMRERKGRHDMEYAKDNRLVQEILKLKLKEGEISEPIKIDKGYSIIKLNQILPPKVKTFEEAIPDFAPTFQDKTQKALSEKWVQNLREKIPVVINNKMIDSLYKKK